MLLAYAYPGRTRNKRSRAGNRYVKLAFSHAAVRAVPRYSEIGAAYRKKLRKKNTVAKPTGEGLGESTGSCGL